MTSLKNIVLPPGWTVTTLGELLREPLRNGHSAKASGTQEGIRTLTLSAVTFSDFSEKNTKLTIAQAEEVGDLWLQPGDILIERSNTRELVGTAALYRGPANFAIFPDLLIRARVNQAISEQYIEAALDRHESRSYFRKKAQGIAGNMPKIDQRVVEALPVPLAPASEQRRIVAKIEELFSALDTGVAALNRVKANLKRYRAAVLQSAVTGKLTEAWRARHPDTEPASELLKRILVERRQQWERKQLTRYAKAGKEPPKGWQAKYNEPVAPEANGLPVLPKGWCWITLGQVARFQNGRAFPSKQYASDGVKLLRPGNLFADGSVRWTEKNTRFMPPQWAEDHPSYLVGGNELVMNLTAQSLADEFLGRICLTEDDECCLLNQRLARITPFNGVNKQFLLYFLKSSVFRRFVNRLNTGSLIEHMFTSQLEDCSLPMPPTEEQREIVQELECRLSIVSDIETQADTSIKRAAHLRQSILKRAFEGRLVPQDPADEPADKLLERIRQERAASNGETKPRKQPRARKGVRKRKSEGAAE